MSAPVQILLSLKIVIIKGGSRVLPREILRFLASSLYLFLKNRDIFLFAGTPGTGSKNRDCPGKIGTLGRPDFNISLL